MIIYKTTNLFNNKIYIGQDSKNNPNYYGSGTIILLAIKKYGKSNFKKEIIEICNNRKELNLREIYWISYFNSTDRKIGYNIAKGGGGALGCHHKGIIFTKEHKNKISENHADVSGKKNPMFGKNHTQTTKDKLRDANLGRHHTYESKLIMSKQRTGEKNIKAKLTEKQVLLIRELYFNSDITQLKLSKMFNVEEPCIYKIVNYRTWKNI